MDEGLIYALVLGAILFNYITKLRIERKGHVVERSNVREGLISGLTAYLLYQTIVQPGIPIYLRIISAALGILSLVAGAIFFIKGARNQRGEF